MEMNGRLLATLLVDERCGGIEQTIQLIVSPAWPVHDAAAMNIQIDCRVECFTCTAGSPPSCASIHASSAGLSSRQPSARGPLRHELVAIGMSSANGRRAISRTRLPARDVRTIETLVHCKRGYEPLVACRQSQRRQGA